MKTLKIKKSEKIVGTYYFYTSIELRKLTISGVLLENKRALLSPKFRMLLGVALCSKKDRFVKRIGREIASGRAVTKPIAIITSREKLSGQQFIDIVQKNVLYDLSNT